MFDVYICYSGCEEKVNKKPMCLLDAWNLIDENHHETQRDLEKLLKKPSCVGLHGAIIDRLKVGDEYVIKDHFSGNPFSSAHRNFEGW